MSLMLRGIRGDAGVAPVSNKSGYGAARRYISGHALAVGAKNNHDAKRRRFMRIQ